MHIFLCSQTGKCLEMKSGEGRNPIGKEESKELENRASQRFSVLTCGRPWNCLLLLGMLAQKLNQKRTMLVVDCPTEADPE